MIYSYFLKKFPFSLLVFLFLGSNHLFAQNTLTVTYIANEGFLFESGTKKILIDGIFFDGGESFYTPTAEALESARNSTAPFNNITVLLNSHMHADHIDPSSVIEHLSNNTSGVLILPQQSGDQLLPIEGYSEVKNRIRPVKWTNHSGFDTTVSDIEIKTHSFTHFNGNTTVQNIGYLIDLNGYKIFHSGDSDPAILDTFQLYNLAEENIDLAFLHRSFFDDGDNSIGEQIINYINPKAIVIMHIKIGDFDKYRQRVAGYSGIPEVYFMEDKMSKLLCTHLNDSLLVTEYVSASGEIHNLHHDLIVFPNPSGGKFSIQNGNNIKIEKISVFNLDGRLIFSFTDREISEPGIDLTAFPRGIYLIEIKTEGTSLRQKIVLK